MSRTTIDFGIDLGTTNSCVAMLKGTETEVIKNNDNQEITPSAVCLTKTNSLLVGQQAKNQFIRDHANAHMEFKLQMGSPSKYRFTRSEREMRPEELSAEVLKELRAAVRQRVGEDLQASVITIPAAFELPQCEATQKAAHLAGIKVSPLLQEPIAAALAYGFQESDRKSFWLVYDLGGGTFDAAIVQLREGLIQVVNHGGDNNLGGKLIDWKIVDEIIAPAVAAEFGLSDFRRGVPRWETALRKLKAKAEEAKIALSRNESHYLEVDFSSLDQFDEPVNFEMELQRSEIAAMAEPLILRSLNLCQQALVEKKLRVEHMEKIILVGGPTLAPYLREQLADWADTGATRIDYQIDPLTVVARGAAIFAGTQLIKRPSAPVVSAGNTFTLELDYKPIDSTTEPLVAGRVVSRPGQDLSGFTIEFHNPNAIPQWRSGKLSLNKDGLFFATLWAERKKANAFQIELRDERGTLLETNPKQISYTIGTTITEQTLVKSIGISLADNTVGWMFRKGDTLPKRRKKSVRSTIGLRAGESGIVAKIPFVEGENPRADRNNLIGGIEISGANIRRDLPFGSEIEVELSFDESRLNSWGTAFVPLLDEEFAVKLVLQQQELAPEVLQAEAKKEKARLEELRSQAEEIEDEIALSVLQKLEDEQIALDLEAALSASGLDTNARTTSQKRLQDLRIEIDKIEDALAPHLRITKAEKEIAHMRWVTSNFGSAQEKKMAASLELEARNLMEQDNPLSLQNKIEEISDFSFDIWQRTLDFWQGFLEWLEGKRQEMANPDADHLFQRAKRALEQKDIEAVKTPVRQLYSYLPEAERTGIPTAYGSTVMRFE